MVRQGRGSAKDEGSRLSPLAHSTRGIYRPPPEYRRKGRRTHDGKRQRGAGIADLADTPVSHVRFGKPPQHFGLDVRGVSELARLCSSAWAIGCSGAGGASSIARASRPSWVNPVLHRPLSAPWTGITGS